MWGSTSGGIKTCKLILSSPICLINSPSMGVVAKTLIFSVTSLVVSLISRGASSSIIPQDTKKIDNVNKVNLSINFNFIKYSFFNY